MRTTPNRGRALLISGLLALEVSGCAAVGPNFKPPAAPAVTGYVAPGERAPSGADAGPGAPTQAVLLGQKVSGDWWTLFRSPELDALVKQAVAGSPTLESAKARLAEAREGVVEARSALYPQVAFTANEEQQRLTAAQFGLSPNVFPLPPNFNLFQVGLNASWSPDIFGGVRRGVERQTALEDYQKDQLYAVYLSLTGQTVSEAIEVAAVRAQQAALAEVLKLDGETLDLVRKERDVGEVPDSDVITAEGQLAADRTLEPALDQQLSVARHALAVLTGRPPAGWSPPDFDLASLTLPGQLPVSLPSELVHQRPDILAAEAQLHAASAQIGIATAQLYPSITLSAGVGGTALNGAELFNPAGLVWSVAAGLTQPVFDGGRRHAQRRGAVDEFRASAADYQQTVLRSFGQVADVLEALTHDSDQLARQQSALDLSMQSAGLQRINYTRGGIGIIDFLVAQRSYQQARLAYARAQAQRYEDTAELLAAMGGGWWGADLAPAADKAAAKPGRD
jgi:NodT family efflux transporter outer membrane factor (OMF) lipoprotein